MFIGHFAVGFGSKSFAPRTNLAVLIAAPLFSDILWPVFLLLGWEHVRIAPGDTRYTPLDLYDYPWSHSLVMTILWATVFAACYHLLTHYRAGTITVWFGVVSHWILDWISHRADMPIYPHGPRYGLGLWNSIPGTIIVELLLLTAGLLLYLRTTTARDRIGRYGFLAFVGLLLFLDVADRFSDPPQNISQIVWPGIVAEVLVFPWIWWFDRHRHPRTDNG